MKLRKTALLLAVALSVITLAGCTLSVGSYFAQSQGRMTGRYATYDGVKTRNIALESGHTLSLDYNIKVSKGTLTLALLNPDGEVVWKEDCTADRHAKIVYTPLTPGVHKLELTAEWTGGSYELKWTIDK